MKIKSSTQTETDVIVELEEAVVAEKFIVLYNDDVNTFEYVIESLIKVCKHEPVQAEQCTFLIHYKGRCTVKTGSYEQLTPLCSALLDRGLTAEIQ